jgi:hypothetical protein
VAVNGVKYLLFAIEDIKTAELIFGPDDRALKEKTVMSNLLLLY